jgi:hypothetical protein
MYMFDRIFQAIEMSRSTLQLLNQIASRPGAIPFASPVCIESAWMLVVLVEYVFRNSVRRPFEPVASLGFTSGNCPTRLLSYWAERDSHVIVVEANGDDRARTDVGAQPFPAAAPETLPDDEV